MILTKNAINLDTERAKERERKRERGRESVLLGEGITGMMTLKQTRKRIEKSMRQKREKKG